MTPIPFKRGTSCSFAISFDPVQTAGGEVTDMTGWTGQSEARRRDGTLVAVLTFAWADPVAGLGTLTGGASDDWSVGLVDIDVMMTSPSGTKAPTQTFTLNVIQGPTHV